MPGSASPLEQPPAQKPELKCWTTTARAESIFCTLQGHQHSKYSTVVMSAFLRATTKMAAKSVTAPPKQTAELKQMQELTALNNIYTTSIDDIQGLMSISKRLLQILIPPLMYKRTQTSLQSVAVFPLIPTGQVLPLVWITHAVLPYISSRTPPQKTQDGFRGIGCHDQHHLHYLQ